MCIRDRSGYDLVTDSPTKRIYEAVKRIPKGHVATYGKIAEMAGDHRMARAVGNALHKNPDPEHIPCSVSYTHLYGYRCWKLPHRG